MLLSFVNWTRLVVDDDEEEEDDDDKYLFGLGSVDDL